MDKDKLWRDVAAEAGSVTASKMHRFADTLRKPRRSDDLDAARGIMLAVALGLAMWVLIGLVWWAL